MFTVSSLPLPVKNVVPVVFSKIGTHREPTNGGLSLGGEQARARIRHRM